MKLSTAYKKKLVGRVVIALLVDGVTAIEVADLFRELATEVEDEGRRLEMQVDTEAGLMPAQPSNEISWIMGRYTSKENDVRRLKENPDGSEEDRGRAGERADGERADGED